MASYYTQNTSRVSEINPLEPSPSPSLIQPDHAPVDNGVTPPPSSFRTASTNDYLPSSTNHHHSYYSHNEVHQIRNRKINSKQAAKRRLELVYEAKVSEHKLEEAHHSLPSSVKSTFIMTFSPDGQRVASTHGDHRIYICDLNTGKLLDTLEGHPKTPWCLAWHPCNKDILASGCLAGEVRVWDLRSKACETWASKNNTVITSLGFHPRERILVIATSNDILFWDWSESEPLARTTTSHDREKVKFVLFDPTGTKLITGIYNLPKYAGSAHPVHNILDSWLSQLSTPEQPTGTASMTPSSETTSSVNRTPNTSEDPNARDQRRLNSNRTFDDSVQNNIGRGSSNVSNLTNNDQDADYRHTMTLSRIAFLYRKLEALEGSLRQTSFTPFIDYHQPAVISSLASENPHSAASETRNRPAQEVMDVTNMERESPSSSHSNSPQTINDSSGNLVEASRNSASARGTAPASGSFEPFLVTFDEYLEQIQLPPLIVDGRVINAANVVELYPNETSPQPHYLMQLECINQVSQNFIRISKLMSSARLYRQIVHQIAANKSDNQHHQPNQILTAQSLPPGSSRTVLHFPVAFRNVNPASPPQSNADPRGERPRADPIQAIQFKNSARNVPLVTMCKIDLLSARAICITRSQLLVEQALQGSSDQAPLLSTLPNNQDNVESNSSESLDYAATHNNPPASGSDLSSSGSLHSMLNQLHTSLTTINQALLTTSNVYAHITSLKILIDKLLLALSTRLNSQSEGRRVIELIHKIASGLTGRQHTIPLGPTLDKICLDVVHALCIVDLTLHFARQVQLLQMQRISLRDRIGSSTPSNMQSDNNGNTSSQPLRPSTSGPSTSDDQHNQRDKRKDAETSSSEPKRRRVEVIEPPTDSPVPTTSTNVEMGNALEYGPNADIIDGASRNPLFSTAEPIAPDRLVVWNSSPNQIDQSLQRFLITSTSAINSSHILFRIYHRLHGMSPSSPPQINNLLPEHADRSQASFQEPTRRRALSQDNAHETADGSAQANLATPPRLRVRAPALHVVPLTAQYQNGNNLMDNWLRQPHLHVYQTRGTGQHLWFNQWTIPLPAQQANYRLQCWDFSSSSVPNIKDSCANLVVPKCRIHNDSSIDISNDGNLLACLVPRDDSTMCLSNFDLMIFSLKSNDFGRCYFNLPHGPNAISVSMSPSGSYAVVGLANHKIIINDPNEDDLIIGKVLKLDRKTSTCSLVRDIKIKRDDSSLSLNAIRWMPRGIVYNVGPQHHQRYHAAARMRNLVVP